MNNQETQIKLFTFLKNIFKIIGLIKSILILLFLFILVCGFGLYFFESLCLWHSLYLAFITALTIGYGDLSPVTMPGQLIAILLGFIGITLTGIFVFTVARAMQISEEKK